MEDDYLDLTGDKPIRMKPVVKPKKTKDIWTNLKEAGSATAKGFNKAFDKIDKFSVGIQKANTGLNQGDKVIITNGAYKGKTMRITLFIKDGVEGTLSDNRLVRIRHRSYKKK